MAGSAPGAGLVATVTDAETVPALPIELSVRTCNGWPAIVAVEVPCSVTPEEFPEPLANTRDPVTEVGVPDRLRIRSLRLGRTT